MGVNLDQTTRSVLSDPGQPKSHFQKGLFLSNAGAAGFEEIEQNLKLLELQQKCLCKETCLLCHIDLICKCF